MASTIIPKAIRYHANGLKSCVATKRNSQRTHRNADRNAKTKPMPKIPRSSAESSARALYSS
ncbi:hypothetical protein D3C72_1946020 [compost metagenome]